MLAPIQFLVSAIYVTIIVWGVLSQRSEKISSMVGAATLLIIGLGFVYWSSSALLNRSSITLDLQRIVSRNGPLPSHLRSRPIDVADVHKIYLHQWSFFQRQPPFAWPYQIRIQTANDEHIKFAGGIQGAERALFLQSVLEVTLDLRSIESDY